MNEEEKKKQKKRQTVWHPHKWMTWVQIKVNAEKETIFAEQKIKKKEKHFVPIIIAQIKRNGIFFSIIAGKNFDRFPN